MSSRLVFKAVQDKRKLSRLTQRRQEFAGAVAPAALLERVTGQAGGLEKVCGTPGG
jgi:hypothetical protein